jgi:phosphoglycerate dehydrogenase-like enzyme
MMRLALLDDYYDNALEMADWSRIKGQFQVESFSQHLDDIDALAARLESFDAVVLMRERTHFPRALIERLPRLKLIITAAMWNAVIDIDAAAEHGIQVCGTGDVGHLTAELTLGLMIALARHIVSEDRELRAGNWQVSQGQGLQGRVLGVIGLGALGQQVARFGTMLGMQVLAWSQNLTDATAQEAGAERVSKEDLLARSDFITVHLKLSDRTRGIIDAASLALMKPSAYLINTSRGPIIDENALYEALKSRRIAGAALDVFSIEPLPATDPIRSLGNVILLPHVGYVTKESWQRIYGDALEDVEAFLARKPIRALNAPAAPRWA